MFRKKLLGAMAVMAILAWLVKPTRAQTQPIIIGGLFDLSGPTADVGLPYAQGVIDYVAWVNGQGGIGGRTIELMSHDYAYDIPNAEQLYAEYVAADAVAIMGWGTADTLALVEKAATDQIPYISGSYDHTLNDPAGRAPYNFLAAPTYADQASILLAYMGSIYEGADLPKIALLHSDTPFGESPLEAAETFLEAVGVESIRIPMPRGANDFSAEIAQAKDFEATHILFQNTSTAPAVFVNQAVAAGQNWIYGCLNWCADEKFIEIAGENAEGVFGLLPFAPPHLDLPGLADMRAYTEANGKDLQTLGVHYVQGWWSIALFAEGIRRTLDGGQTLDGPNLRASLESLRAFETGDVSAPISFSAEDHRGSRQSRIYVVEGGLWVAETEMLLTVPDMMR
jgi:branched-chain amino acid transport system substrate-binding protein